MLEAYTLFSGSTGNCVYIKTGGGEILVDCGKNAKTVECALQALGSSLCRISAIYITHEHVDHVSALEVISRRYRIPVHAAAGTAAQLGTYARACVIEHAPRYALETPDYTIRSFVTPHDSVMCVGYRISTDDGDIAVATDLGCVTDEAGDAMMGCRGVILESNHDVEMLKRGPYPAMLKRRILSRQGHLSNDDCAYFAAILARGGTERLLLAHISRENNQPELALAATKCALDKACALDTQVRAASPVEITPLF
jgi:phosphoribosyl 1,2-cyclic phosphodiesterase